MALLASEIVRNKQQKIAEEFVKHCSEMQVTDLHVTYAISEEAVTVPATLIKFALVSVLFGLDEPKKWQAALARGCLPDELPGWLGHRSLESLAREAGIDWVPRGVFVDLVSEETGRRLIELAQPRPQASVRKTVRRLFLRKTKRGEDGLVMRGKSGVGPSFGFR